MTQKYIVTKDADMLAPSWLTARINYKSVKFIYVLKDGIETLKGVKTMTAQQKSATQFVLTVSGYQ